MSSLLITASPWINDETNIPRKRTSTIRKNISKQPTVQSYEDNDEYIINNREGLQNIEPSTIEKSQTINDDRSMKINNLLNQMTNVSSFNDDSKLANFNPPPAPIIIQKSENNGVLPNELLPQKQKAHELYYNNINNKDDINLKAKISYSANDSNLGVYSNYKKSYEPPSNIQLKPYYSNMGVGNGNTDDKLMEKINYMIHLLEEQQNEKTNNVTEEFILYTFLGIFIIYVVDSFARAGKYSR